jgi:hypothetical protein
VAQSLADATLAGLANLAFDLIGPIETELAGPTNK